MLFFKLIYSLINYIFKRKILYIKKNTHTQFLFYKIGPLKKKKALSHTQSTCDEASYYLRDFLYLNSYFFMSKVPSHSFA